MSSSIEMNKLQSNLRDLSSTINQLVDSSTTELVMSEVLGCLTRGIPGFELDLGSLVRGSIEAVTTPCSDEQVSEISSNKRKNSMPRRSGYRRRLEPYTCKKVLTKTMEDAYSWRKYGQKDIFNTKHPRHYFRCTHKFDKGCQATRQVQKNNEDTNYEITYMGEHTCMHNQSSINSTLIIDFASSNELPINDQKSINEPTISPSNPPLNHELSCDEEMISCETQGSSSSDLLLFAQLPEIDDSTLEQLCDVKSSFHDYSLETFYDHLFDGL